MSKSKVKIELEPTSQPHMSEVYLHLDDRAVFIGKLANTGEGTFQTSRDEQQVFRKTRSIGLSFALLSDPNISFKWITINYRGRKLVSTRGYFLKKGKYMHFAGYELQSFVPIDEMNISNARQFEQEESEDRAVI